MWFIQHPLETLFLYLPTILIIVFLIMKKDFIKEHKNIIRFTYLALLIISAVYRYYRFCLTGDFNFFNYFLIPQFYCDVTFLTMTYFLITEDKRILPIVSLTGFIGIVAILLPLNYSFGNNDSIRNLFNDLAYIIDHTIYATAGLMFIMVYDYKPSKEQLKTTIIFSMILCLLYALPLTLIFTGDNVMGNQDFFFFRSRTPFGESFPIYIYAPLFTIAMALFMTFGNFIHTKFQEKYNN